MKLNKISFLGGLFLCLLIFINGCGSSGSDESSNGGNTPESEIVIGKCKEFVESFPKGYFYASNCFSSGSHGTFYYMQPAPSLNSVQYLLELEKFYKSCDLDACYLSGTDAFNCTDSFGTVIGYLNYQWHDKNSSTKNNRFEQIEIVMEKENGSWKITSMSGRNKNYMNFPPKSAN